MQLGGTPANLYDQARDGVADVVWTLAGNSPGRFPRVEVFEDAEGITLIADLPGVSSERLNVQVDKDTLQIEGSADTPQPGSSSPPSGPSATDANP